MLTAGDLLELISEKAACVQNSGFLLKWTPSGWVARCVPVNMMSTDDDVTPHASLEQALRRVLTQS